MDSTTEIEDLKQEIQELQRELLFATGQNLKGKSLFRVAISRLGPPTNYKLIQIMPMDIAKAVRSLWVAAENWVISLLEPIIEVQDAGSSILTDIKKNIKTAKPFYQLINNNPDFQRLIRYPDQDYDLLKAIVIRFLIEQIFEKGLYDNKKQPSRFIQSMRDEVASRTLGREYGLLALQFWRTYTYAAFLSLPEAGPEFWEPYMKDVTKRLRRLLGCLRTAPHFESCMEKFENKVLPAARKIQENMVLSMDKYSFSIEKFEQTENRRARIERLLKNHGAKDSLEGIRKDEYHDVLRALRFIPVESTVKDELDELLDPVCTLDPRLLWARLEYENNGVQFATERRITETYNLIAYGQKLERQAMRESGTSFFSSICQLVAG
ncbi:hypothetical protein F4823DRAFT_630322 [Ustulina deusta]|nr:hypothetical protein F4823DRAFT_630322 [Ustulina deusta]